MSPLQTHKVAQVQEPEASSTASWEFLAAPGLSGTHSAGSKSGKSYSAFRECARPDALSPPAGTGVLQTWQTP